MIYKNKIPKDLIEALINRKAVLFLGSGLSIQSNMPSWEELANLVSTKLKNDESLPQKIDPIQIFQKYVDESNSRIPLINLIKKEFNLRKAKYNTCHKILVKLPVRYFITTNWDDLLENAIKDTLKIIPNLIWSDNQVSTLGEIGPHIIKFHGSLTDADSLILTEEDYLYFKKKQPLLIKFVVSLFANSVILFIGYSFSDFDLKLIFSSIQKHLKLKKQPTYIFLPNESKWSVEYLNARGLIPIFYKNQAENKTELTLKFLKELSEKAAVYSIDRVERTRILIRENRKILENIESIDVIRNWANLGAFGVPEPSKTTRVFSDEKDFSPEAEEIDNLEWEGHKIWLKFAEKGIKFRQIICLNKNAILQRYTPNQAKIRLKIFHSLNEKFDPNQIQVLFQDAPIYINETIFGDLTLIQLRKASISERVYSQIRVIKDQRLILESIELFDAYFRSLKDLNLKQAISEDLFKKDDISKNPNLILKKSLQFKIINLINEI